MKKIRIAVISVAAIIVVGVFAVCMLLSTPEYELYKTKKDYDERGGIGIISHLSKDLREQVTADLSHKISDDQTVNFFFRILMQDISLHGVWPVDWAIEKYSKDKDRYFAIVSFDMESDIELAGTVEIRMIREDGKWRISSVDNYKANE